MASSLEVNKILAALLTAGIIASGTGVISRIIYHPSIPEEQRLPDRGGRAARQPAGRRRASRKRPTALSAVLLAAAAPRQAQRRQEMRRLSQLRAGRPEQDRTAAVGRARPRHRLGRLTSPTPTPCARRRAPGTTKRSTTSWPIPRTGRPAPRWRLPGSRTRRTAPTILVYLRSLSDSPPPLPEPTTAEAAAPEQVAATTGTDARSTAASEAAEGEATDEQTAAAQQGEGEGAAASGAEPAGAASGIARCSPAPDADAGAKDAQDLRRLPQLRPRRSGQDRAGAVGRGRPRYRLGRGLHLLRARCPARRGRGTTRSSTST